MAGIQLHWLTNDCVNNLPDTESLCSANLRQLPPTKVIFSS